MNFFRNAPSGNAGAPIGLFDSGVGGLSVLRAIEALLPGEALLYVADQAHVPYGLRPAAEVRRLSEGVTRFLLAQRVKLIVVACNTASAAALGYLREQFPAVSFVGMEPAVKPGAARSQSGKIGVLATTGTFGSQRYADLLARYAQGVAAFEDPCLGLVEQIETGAVAEAATRQILEQALAPMLAAGIDTVVLGCTHYPFVRPLIRALVGPAVQIIDPAPAVARQAQRLLHQQALLNPTALPGQIQLFTSGDPLRLASLSEQLLNRSLPTGKLLWQEGNLVFGQG